MVGLRTYNEERRIAMKGNKTRIPDATAKGQKPDGAASVRVFGKVAAGNPNASGKSNQPPKGMSANQGNA